MTCARDFVVSCYIVETLDLTNNFHGTKNVSAATSPLVLCYKSSVSLEDVAIIHHNRSARQAVDGVAGMLVFHVALAGNVYRYTLHFCVHAYSVHVHLICFHK